MNGGGLCAQESRDSRNLWFQKLPVLYTMKTSEGGFMKLLNTCRCWSENRQNNAAPRSTQHSIFRFSFLILNVKPPALTFWERKIWFHRKNGFQVIFLRGWGLDFIFSRKCLECVSHGFLCFWSCLQHFFCLLTSFMWISRFFLESNKKCEFGRSVEIVKSQLNFQHFSFKSISYLRPRGEHVFWLFYDPCVIRELIVCPRNMTFFSVCEMYFSSENKTLHFLYTTEE